MLNCKKLFKLQIRPPSLNPVDYYIPVYVNISQPKLTSEKFDVVSDGGGGGGGDDDNDDDNDYNNNNNNNNNNVVLTGSQS